MFLPGYHMNIANNNNYVGTSTRTHRRLRIFIITLPSIEIDLNSNKITQHITLKRLQMGIQETVHQMENVTEQLTI